MIEVEKDFCSDTFRVEISDTKYLADFEDYTYFRLTRYELDCLLLAIDEALLLGKGKVSTEKGTP